MRRTTETKESDWDKFKKGIQEGNAKQVQSLLNETPALANAKGEEGETALHHAAAEFVYCSKEGREKVVEILLSRMNPELINAIDKNGMTALHSAARNGNEKLAGILLKLRPELINEVDKDGQTALHHAAASNWGSGKVLEMLLKLKPKLINAVDKNGETVLDTALTTSGHNNKIIKMLLQIKPELINAVGKDGNTVLHKAAQCRNSEEAVEILLKHKPELVNAIDKGGKTALHGAAQRGNELIAGVLLSRMNPELTKVSDKDGKTALDYGVNMGWTALHFASAAGQEKAVGTMLKLKPESINAVDNKGKAALHWAAIVGQEKVVEMMFQLKPESIFAVDEGGMTALHFGAAAGHGKVVEMILQHKPESIFAVAKGGMTALHMAAQKGHEKVVGIMLQLEPESISAVNNGMTVLHFAAQNGHEKVVEILLSKMNTELINAITTTQGIYGSKDGGETALHLAIRNRHEKVLEVLLQRKPEMINAVNQGNKNALHLAAENGQEKIVEMIIQLKPELIDAIDYKNNSALYYAAASNHERVVEMMIVCQPELVNTVTKSGRTALQQAASAGNKKVVEVLLPRMSADGINLKDNAGMTALHWAAAGGHVDIVGELLPRMSLEAVKAVNKQGKTAFQLAAAAGNVEVVGMISKAKAALEVQQEALKAKATLEAQQEVLKAKAALEAQQEALKAEAALEAQQEALKAKAAFEAQQEREREANINQDILGEVIELVREGNDKIHQTVEKGILLLGKTGSGKSTLATIMAGRKLQAIRDEEEGGLIIDALNPLKDIIISNSKVAETRIPNKCIAGDIVIWDCPGFHDNRGIAQEIVNGFYIKRLFETTKALKFVLVIPESALSSNRGVDFIDTVNQLIRSFTDVSVMDRCISLVVTTVPIDKEVINITKSIERITSQNTKLAPEVIKTIGYLLKSVHIFHKPTSEGPFEIEYDFLAAINESIRYAVDVSDYARISISDASMDYVHHILKTAQSKFSEIVGIILNTASESHGCITNPNNRLTGSYKTIEKLLPKSIAHLSPRHLPEHKDSKEGEYFTDIAVLSCLRDVINVGSTLSMANTNETLGFLNNILKTFEEYIGSGSRQQELLKSQIQGYTYVINQQMEYIKFFSKLCGQEILGYLSALKQPIVACKGAVLKNLEVAVKSIVIAPNHTDQEYYNTALKYLKLYCDKEWSTKAQATTHIYLAELSEPNEAIGHYLKSLHLDKKLPTIYSKLGDLLFKAKEYKAAIDCFKAINNSFEIEKCFKQLMELNPKNPEITRDAADYFASIGRYSKATKLYQHAFSFSQDDGFKSEVWHKKNHILKDSSVMAIKLAERDEAQGFYDFDSVNPEALLSLMGDHVSFHL